MSFANRVDPDQRSSLFVIYNYSGEFTQIIYIDWPYSKIGSSLFKKYALKGLIWIHCRFGE